MMPVTRNLSRSAEDWKRLLFDISQMIPPGPDMNITKTWLRQCQMNIQSAAITSERQHRELESFLMKFPSLLPAARPIILRFLTPTSTQSSAGAGAATSSPTPSPATLEAALTSALAPENKAPSISNAIDT